MTRRIVALMGAFALVLGLGSALVVSTASPSSAAPGDYSISTRHETTCGAVTVFLRNQSPWIYPVSVSRDGTTPNASGPLYGPVVDNRGKTEPFDTTGSRTYRFAEDSGPQVVKYVVNAGTERDLWVGKPVGEVTTVEVETDCLPNITLIDYPATPQIDDPCGLDNATWVVPEDDDTFEWTLTDDGRLIAEIIKPDTTFKNGTTVNSWGTATDSNEPCPVVEVDAPVVTITNQQCTPNTENGTPPVLTDGSITIPENAAYTVSIESAAGGRAFGNETGAAEVTGTSVGPGVYEVRLVPVPDVILIEGNGFEKQDDGSLTQLVTIAAAEDCTVVFPTPSPTPSETPSPTPSETGTPGATTPSMTPPATATPPATEPARLAQTGASLSVVGVGLALLLAGGLALVSSRSRTVSKKH